MVGVAGRSKACATCRRRRVKCDETKPKCQRCIRGNYDCGGYRQMRFIPFKADSSLSVNLDSSSTASNHASDNALAPFQVSGISNEHQARSLSLSLSPVLDMSAFQENMCIAYTLEYLLSGPSYDGITPVKSHDWSTEPLTSKCFLSLAMTYFGSQQQEYKLLRKGFKLYGVALEELNTALKNSYRRRTRDVLDSIIFMSLFEYLISEDPNGWISHSSGPERLFEIRGPASFQNIPERFVLEKSRHTIIFAALALRKGTILSSLEWKIVPWASNPEEKSSTEFLVDILADCPDVCMRKEEIVASGDVLSVQSSARDTINRISTILDDLEAWKTRWNQELEEACFEVAAPLTSPVVLTVEGEIVPVWSTVIHYKSLSAANQIAFYKAILILLLKLVEDLLPFTDGQSFPDGPVYPRMYAAGIDICRSVDYHVLQYQARAASFNLLFPLRLAWQAVGHSNSSVGQWLEHILHMVAFGTSDGKSTLGGKWAVARYLLKDFANIKGTGD